MATKQYRLRSERCSGWQCLTPAEQFGVIFSIVVIIAVLLVAWMYLLGKKVVARRSRNMLTLPGGREVHRRRNLPENVALGQLPIVHQWPGQSPQVYYQPVVYSLDPHGQHHAQPYHMTGPYIGQGPFIASHQETAVPAYPQSLCNATTFVAPSLVRPPQALHNPSSPVSRVTAPTPTHQANPSSQRPSGDTVSGNRSPTRHLNIFQRLTRLLRMPTGRASTIVSSEGGGSLRRSCSTTRSAASAADRNREESRQALRHAEQDREPRTPDPRPQTPQSPDDAETNSSISMPTNLATVHSDDYDVIRVPSEHSERPFRQQSHGREDARGRNLDQIDEVSSISSSDEGNERIGVAVSTVSMPEQCPIEGLAQSEKSDQLKYGRGLKQRNIKPASKIPRYVQSQIPAVTSGRGCSSGAQKRDSARAAWDQRRSSTQETFNGDDEGPSAPSAIHQGGGSYRV